MRKYTWDDERTPDLPKRSKKENGMKSEHREKMDDNFRYKLRMYPGDITPSMLHNQASKALGLNLKKLLLYTRERNNKKKIDL